MSGLRRRPVVYRFQIRMWLVIVTVSTVLAIVFVPTAREKVVALVAVVLAAVAAALVWRVSEYRVYRLGPVTSTGSDGWVLVSVAVNFAVARLIGGGGPFFASVAGFGIGMALTLPLFTYVTAFRDPPPDPTTTTSDRSGASDG